MLLENAENEINVTPEKRSRGLDPMSGITFGGVKKRFDVLRYSLYNHILLYNLRTEISLNISVSVVDTLEFAIPFYTT